MDGFAALPYHAGLSDEERNLNQKTFVRDEALIIVATIAFGKGINKSNIRYVVHYALPKNLETYYQEIGRSGRDGLPPVCMLFYGYSDLISLQRIIEENEDPEQIQVARMQLDGLMRFIHTNQCRRIPLLSWFGEKYQARLCGMCDNCINFDLETEDVSIQAQQFLSAVFRSGECFGVELLIHILRGSKNKKILHHHHDQLSTYGIGKDWSMEQWYSLYHHLNK